MNAEFKKLRKINGGLVIVLVFVAGLLLMSGGCAYNRATEDGALARVGFNFEILPSSSSDDKLAVSNTAIKTTTENEDPTNAHTSGIKKTRALTNVTTTTTTGPGPHNTSWAPNRDHIRN